MTRPLTTPWDGSGQSGPRGSVTPRLWTPPLVEGPPGPCGCGCALTELTSDGFEAVRYAEEVLGAPYRPWQRWLVIHSGELYPDGRPRFSFVLVLVARQNGKTEVVVRLTPYWLTETGRELVESGRYDHPPVVLGTSTKVEYAKESWEKVLRLMQRRPHLAAVIPSNGVRRVNGEQEITTGYGTRYKIAAQNDDAGRSLTVFRGVLDEMRQMQHYDAYDALVNATNAVPEGQVWGLTNQGDERAVVLDQLRDSALHYIHTGQGDPRLGLFEWSAPPGSAPDDPEALAAANPDLNRGQVLLDTLIGRARRAKAAGGDQLARFQIEVLCMRVRKLDPAVPPEHFRGCLDESLPPGMEAHRGRVACCLDVSLDGLHATLAAAAAMDDGRVRVVVAGAWDGQDATARMRRELPALLRQVRPRVLAWFPDGPAAAVAASLLKPKGGRPSAAPPGVRVQAVRGEATAACMGLAELFKVGEVAHSGDPLLEQHVTGSERLWQGDAWRFMRRGAGHCDAAYAAAGAAHEARLLPRPVRPGVVKPADRETGPGSA